MMLENIATQIGLTIDQPYLMISIVVAGYLFINEALFSKALMLLLFTMVYNPFLKDLWQIPLPPALAGVDAWAFPSGHMHSAFVFWGWLAFDSRNRYAMALTFVLLSCTGFGLVHKGYHYPLDVIGAIAFGTVTLTVFHVVNLFEPFKSKWMLNGLWLFIAALFFFLLISDAGRKLYMYQGIGALAGFTIGGIYAQKRPDISCSKLKHTLSAAFIIAITCGIFLFSKQMPSLLPKPAMIFCTWLIIAAWIASSKRIFKLPHAKHQLPHAV